MNKTIPSLPRWLALTFSLIFIAATSAPATVTIDPAFSGSSSEVNSTADQAYAGDQSGSDLIEGLTATVATGWNLGSGSTVAELNDGIHGAYPGGDAEGTWTNEGAIVEYNLGSNELGYNISAIQTIASWSDVGFGNQVWTVEVKPVGGDYALLATVNYTPTEIANSVGATKVNLTSLDATGIESIRFTAGSTAGNSLGNDFVFREIDVVGAATPSTPDLTAPLVNSLIPADGAGDISLVDDLVVTFNEIIAIGTGNITIKNLDTGSQAVIPVGDSQVSVFGTVLKIKPANGLDPSANYAIRIDENAITDIAGNSFTGILDDITWNFTTASVNLVKVILLGGQSNAVGQGDNTGLPTSPVNLQLPQDDVLFYYTGVGGGLTTLRPGSGGVTMGSEAKFGVEVTFGREIADANPSVTYAIIKHAESGTALYNDWALGTGSSYTAFRNTVAAGLAALQNAGYTTEIVGMLWHQGESDALEEQQANYANNLTAFIADIRSRYGANLPFFIGEIRHNGPAYMTVVNAQAAIAAADPFARFVPATDLSFYDFFHFDAAGMITLGERFATAFLDLVSNDPGSDVTIASGFSGSFTAVSDSSDSAYEGDQSASDLLHGLTATVASVGWTDGGGATLPELNDGIHGGILNDTDAQGTWSNEGAIAEYNLGPNAAGYDITSIQSIASWTGSGFGNQVWTVEVKPVGGNYVLLATVNYAPFDNTGGATKVNLTGLNATGIESIRFTAGSTDGKSVGNDFVFREIDVEGTAVPTASHVTIASGFSGSFTAVSDSSDSAYEGDQSASDLLHGLTATVASVGWTDGGGATLPELNDGIHGAFPEGDAQGTWSNEGAIAEYNLGPNAAGYDITSIQSIASWTGSGFGNQVWTVEVKPVGGNYVLLATVNYAPFDNTGGATKVNLTGLNATGIESIRFTAGSTDGKSVGNDFVFREIDVEGAATPPASDVTIAPAFSGAFTAVSDPSDSAYEGDQSASDLLNGLTATVASVGWTDGGGATLPELNDGIHGAFPEGDAEGTWSNEGAIAEYNLGPNAFGYDITSIQSIASWTDSGFGNQVWTVEVKPVGGNYVLLATVNYAPFDNTGGATKVNLTGLNATGIESIRFTAGSTDGKSVGDNFVFREIDVEGVATPEPLRIMCLGDSLTVGYTDNPNWTHPFKFGYRSGLYTRLTNAGYNFLFVGASAEPWNGKSGDPTNGGTYTPALDLRDFGQDGHRGYSGQGIWDNVDAYIAADNPDVILLLIGINGLGMGSQAALTNLVDNIVTTAPDVHLIVAQTSPVASFNQILYDYNVYIRDTLVPGHVTAGNKVSTVDLYTPFLVDPDNYASAIKTGVLSNNINHPDNPHYDLMAQEWYEGIQALDFDSDDFASWITDPAFGLGVADQDFDDDADNDHLSNGLEAWFGTSPGQFNTGITNISTTGNVTTFTHPQNATVPDDVTGYYEWSPNLTDWYTSGNGPGGGSTITFSASTSGTTTTVTATVTGATDRIFLRAGVNQNN